jgi:ATP synthase protein I
MARRLGMDSRPSRDRLEERTIGQWYRLTGVGVEFIVAVLMLGGAGWLADRWLGTMPWLMLAGGLLGFGVGLWLMIRAARGLFHD